MYLCTYSSIYVAIRRKMRLTKFNRHHIAAIATNDWQRTMSSYRSHEVRSQKAIYCTLPLWYSPPHGHMVLWLRKKLFDLHLPIRRCTLAGASRFLQDKLLHEPKSIEAISKRATRHQD